MSMRLSESRLNCRYAPNLPLICLILDLDALPRNIWDIFPELIYQSARLMIFDIPEVDASNLKATLADASPCSLTHPIVTRALA